MKAAILAILLVLGLSAPVSAISEPPVPEAPESLAIVRIKITGEEYIEIQNNSSEDIDDLSAYSIQAFNDVDPLTSGAATSTQSFPAFKLGQGDRLLLNNSIRPTCGAAYAGKLTLSLVDGGGTVRIIKASALSETETKIIDTVSWSSSSKGDIAHVPSNSKVPNSAYYRFDTGDQTYDWQQARQNATDLCSLIVEASGDKPEAPVLSVQPLATSLPFSVSVADSGADELVDLPPSAPVLNTGLTPVSISELMPNPAGSGNDASDEFIELLNSNNTAVDISGHVLQTGVATVYTYRFPQGTIIPAGSHRVFFSSETKLSMTNSLGQAALLSPTGVRIAATEIYRSAKDGQSWSVFDNLWKWTVIATPGKHNVLSLPPQANKPATAKPATLKKTPKAAAPKTLKSAKSPKPKKDKKLKTDSAAKFSAMPTAATVESRPIQTRVIASIALIALLYFAYEYRGDLANKYQQCRRHLKAWRPYRR